MIDLERIALQRQEEQMAMPKAYFAGGTCLHCDSPLPQQARIPVCKQCKGKVKVATLSKNRWGRDPNRLCAQPGCDQNLSWVNKSGLCQYHSRYPTRVGPPR